MKNLLFMVIVGTFIGWVTNYIAIKLLFRPYNEINILGFKLQGVIPKRRKELAENIGKTINAELISIKDITNTIDSMELEIEIDKIVGDIVEKKIKGEFLGSYPMLKMFINDSIIDKIKSYIKSAIEENKGEIVNTIIGKLEKEIDFEDLIIKKINEFSLEDVEKMTINIAKNELKHIEYIGAVLGAFIGVIQYLLITII
ncbi:MAG: DUF445 family protein [Fusobacteriaceae bacterium]|nr:DUF445 family protein [Fusobacteriaceae bacterium]MBP9595726.1 DUF445 family protein [Fusobacteriaceae bacterium]MBU9917008.1 DUF445 family protein [Fusobacteriaceae bacterium]